MRVLVLVALAGLVPSVAAAAPVTEDPAGRPLLREPALSISPRLSPLGANALNHDFGVGLSITVHPVGFVAGEFNVSGFPLGGPENATEAAVTGLESQSRPQAFESIDRIATLTGALLGVPFSGSLGPARARGPHLEFLIGGGGGTEVVHIESLTLQGSSVGLVVDPIVHVRPVVMGLIGLRVVPMPQVAFRLDLRVLGGGEQVLDYSTEEADAVNRSLPQNTTANRLLCIDPTSEAMCTTAPYGAVTLEFAAEFTLGARWERD